MFVVNGDGESFFVGWGGGNGLYMRELNMCVRRLKMQA